MNNKKILEIMKEGSFVLQTTPLFDKKELQDAQKCYKNWPMQYPEYKDFKLYKGEPRYYNHRHYLLPGSLYNATVFKTINDLSMCEVEAIFSGDYIPVMATETVTVTKKLVTQVPTEVKSKKKMS